MKKNNIIILLLSIIVLSSCHGYNTLLKSSDYEYKYEAAKCYFAQGKYTKAENLLNDVIMLLKGTDKAEESVYMLGMSYYGQGDYATASQSFVTYYTTYPRGEYAEDARFYAGKALFLDTAEPRLDQTNTYSAIQQLQLFMEYFPDSKRRVDAQNMIFELQDKLVMKEVYNARLYYNLGIYLGNNYQSCVIVAQDALKDYPYTKFREELSMLILRSKYQIAVNSVKDKQAERYRDAIDEYYGFKNEFPNGKFIKEATKIFEDSKSNVKDK
jgi:outer membrane protein assembly factor BamD